MRLREVSLRPYSALALSPLVEFPPRLSVFHGCYDIPYSLSLVLEYQAEYGAYWLDALRDDVEDMVDELQGDKKLEMFAEVLEKALKDVSDGVVGAIESLTLASLTRLPSFTNDPRALTLIEYEVHVRRKYKEVVNKEIPKCLGSLHIHFH